MFNRWWDILIGVLFGLVFAGLIILVCKPKSGTAILIRPPPTPAPMIVNIDGAVHYPGVYSLPIHSRVEDAVKAAGGFTENARPGSINLAALLKDESHIFIPYQKSEAEIEINNPDQVYGLSASGEIVPLININQAPIEILITLPGIGPVTGEKIIAYREEKLFTQIEDIQKVPGIGPATFERIKNYISVGE
jgi:competence protein ComEA